jgi:type II restriction/modification system DNA methylase subunit YeeA
MNTNKLKKFAQETRRKLIALVSARLDYVLNADTAELRGLERQVEEVQKQIKESSREELIEKVAYTWFNRFMALRFMDANDYHGFRVRVISPAEGLSQPEILEKAKAGDVDADLKLDRVKLEEEISAGADNAAMRRLVVAVCNHYFEVMPFMFEKVSDYTELLMPEDMLSDSCVVAEMVEAMGPEECENVEVIGWLYQFYISEKKDEVFAALKKNVKITAQNIPAATQLFTPNWIVRYMVENSLGRLWLLNRPNSGLKQHMKYFVETEPEKEFLKIGSPEEIKLCDPACGSGHILVYGFDLLVKIYEEEGYDSGEIPGLILTKNLFGIDIDDRAAALASFALMMKGRGYYRRFFRKGVQPSVIAMQNVRFEAGEIESYVKEVGDGVFSVGLRETLGQFEQAKNFGSLIKPEVWDVDGVKVVLKGKNFEGRMFSTVYETHEKVKQVLEMVEYLAPRYHCVVANPPYMGGKGMNGELGDFVKEKYKDTKGDLFACFMARCIDGALKCGYMGMINQHSWMFLSSFEEYRKSIIETKHISSMLHLGPRVFAELAGEVVQSTAFVIQNAESGSKGTYYRLVDERSGDEKRERLENGAEGHVFRVSQKDFTKIPGGPVAYWVPVSLVYHFDSLQPLTEKVVFRKGLVTADNDKYIRFWHEVSINDSDRNCVSRIEAKERKKQWFPYVKGGEFRKWYGNNNYFLNWKNDGEELQKTKHHTDDRIAATNFNLEYIFKKSGSYSSISSSNFSCRFTPEGFLYDQKGGPIFSNNSEDIIDALLLLNSNLSRVIIKILCPTLDFNPGSLSKFPLKQLKYEKKFNLILSIAKKDWDSDENSWDFSINPLINVSHNSLRPAYKIYRNICRGDIQKMKALEEENNLNINLLYGMENEISAVVPIKEITLNCNPHYRYGSNHTEAELEALLLADTMRDLLSYATGCMLGRYSLDKPGLILANQGETLADYLKVIPTPSFMPDEDNIIPIVDGDYFSDDIVSRFKTFLKVSFGPEHYQENLNFIEDALGKDLRKYFLKDFYPDHLKRYKKRPIYWLFSSPKGSFNCLIYMHRYRPDTVSRIVSNYLQEFIHKLGAQTETLKNLTIKADTTPAAKAKAEKEMDKIKKTIKELQDYERDTMLPLAQQKIEIDLDDGVKQNYPKFGPALFKIPGLDSKDD